MSTTQQPGAGHNDPDPDAWVDLAANLPGSGVVDEGARRRARDGAGADRSWRIGADGEVAVAHALAELTEISRWGRVRGRRPQWRVLHSVPLGDGRGRPRGDIDHVLVGPPGVVTVNTKHHRTGRLELDGEHLVLGGRLTDYVSKARREAERARALLQAALPAGRPAPSVRPFVVIVGGRLTAHSYPAGVTVVMTGRLVHSLRALRPELDRHQVDAVFETARRSTTWNPPGPAG